MRRVAGIALVLLGAFLLGVAGMSRFYVADRLVVIPLDQYAQTVAPGPGTYLDVGALRVRTGDLVARRTVKGVVAASTEDVAVWEVSVVLETGDGAFVRAGIDRLAVDRRTGEAVDCCDESVDGTPARHSGVSYKFPFDTERRDYALWDVNSRRAYPARYVTEEQVQGLTTYKFIQQIPGVQLHRQEVPAALVGEGGATFDAPVWYQNTRTVWVEPRTGIIVKGNEQNSTTLRDSQGQDRVPVVAFDLTFDDPTQARQARLARDGIAQIRLVTVWLPLLGLLLGLILVVAGAIVLRAGDRDPGDADRADRPVPAGAR